MDTKQSRGLRIIDGLKLTGGLVVVLWAIEIVDTFALGSSLQRNGIVPRHVGGLDGILWAPFLHGDFGHIGANSVPLLVLGALITLRGVGAFVGVSALVAVVGGGAVWLMAREANHIGASGVIFGYLGFLLAVGIFERRLTSILVSVVVGFVYGGLLFGVLPTDAGISWEGHLFGFVAGLLAARLYARDRREQP